MATPTLALIPTGYKAGKLYSVLPESGVGDFTVVRATEATRVNEEGLIETMGANVPRLDYSGGGCPVLLTEPQRTNSITYSNDFSQSIYNKIDLTITANQGISPDGTQNANLLVPNAAVGLRYITNNTGSNLKINTVFLKKKELRYVKVGNAQSNVLVDLENGTISADSVSTNNFTIENYGNGWYRVSCYNTLDVDLQIQIFVGIDGSGSNIATNGTDGVYIYGFEIQNGSYPTSYIKTSGSAVTRNADQVTGAGDAATFNDSEGVLMAEISALTNDGTQRAISIYKDTSLDNLITIQYNSVSNNIRYLYRQGVVSVSDINFVVNDIKANHKIAATWKQNDFKLFVDGIKVGEQLSGNVAPLNTFVGLDFKRPDGHNFYGNTSQIQYFNTVLTDSELETLTSWTSFIEMAQALNYNII